MFVKDKNSSESYIHVCKGKKLKDMDKKGLEIRLHDVSIFSLVYNESKKMHDIVHLKFCPYCGINLENDFTETIVYNIQYQE